MTERIGNWIQTYTGRKFFPLDPRPEEVDIKDIAHALSMTCRFNGHCIRFYSVAEHSCLMFDNAPDEIKPWVLLHDASEAYVTDVPRPLKLNLRDYKEIEARVMSAIAKKYNLSETMPPEVKKLDNAILSTEADQNMSKPPEEWHDREVPLDIELQYWSPETAKKEFVNRFETIKGTLI